MGHSNTMGIVELAGNNCLWSFPRYSYGEVGSGWSNIFECGQEYSLGNMVEMDDQTIAMFDQSSIWMQYNNYGITQSLNYMSRSAP